MHPSTQNPRQYPQNPPRRPATIAELAERALDGLWDETKELKHYLRVAERYRKDGKEHVKQGDLESAFVEFARAATLVLEKLPTHRDYHTLLNAAQRHNLGLNGQDILDHLSDLKPTLLERHERWMKEHPNGEHTPEARQSKTYDKEYRELNRQHSQRQPERRHEEHRVRGKERDHQRDIQEQRRIGAEEMARYNEEQRFLREEEERERQRQRTMSRPSAAPQDRRKESAALAAARDAAGQSQSASIDYTFSRPPNGGRSRTPVADTRRQQDGYDRYQQQQQQEEMRQREEEIMRKREQKRRQEQDGIARRQQEADEAARAVRHNIAVNNTGLSVEHTPSSLSSTPSMSYSTSSASSSLASTPSSSFYATTPTQAAYAPGLQAPTAQKSRPPSFVGQLDEVPSIMPLESPTRYEGDSTDSESVTTNGTHDWRRAGKQKAMESSRTPVRAPARSPSYPPPITTTSPPPVEGGRIHYPQLMSQHQKRQGYWPSLNSMFGPQNDDPVRPSVPPSLFFVPDSSSKGLYPQSMLPAPSAPLIHSSYPYAPPAPHTNRQKSHSPHPQSVQYPSYPGPSRPAPPVPEPVPPPASAPHHSRSESERIMRSANPSDPSPVLRTVTMPRECLPRFLTLAKANTNMNLETCGLLLGKDKGTKFVVTTLLIPKQHSTSDTCTMDEEELVMQFTEGRNLITLGWIHTHPSQSCFMSSVDLHTHSGFQRMLPESFAVVCAPKSTPNFGIFRLTDPPGLKTVLECTAKEAFHPHPDLPIYTDADKGHVQMKDMSLEIVDLR
ncbi:hypothetical protein BDZ94DRAFT_1261890 [Collybia nuda]|uniref:MPN domain-containing protein n=1 Tax=Collybia nuda TaxID=64659 RepID=A0A9P5Y402_9AGAR|nr:hypothetical protein BDZ94DRAFT_1261890 [Collybia nuda]